MYHGVIVLPTTENTMTTAVTTPNRQTILQMSFNALFEKIGRVAARRSS